MTQGTQAPLEPINLDAIRHLLYGEQRALFTAKVKAEAKQVRESYVENAMQELTTILNDDNKRREFGFITASDVSKRVGEIHANAKALFRQVWFRYGYKACPGTDSIPMAGGEVTAPCENFVSPGRFTHCPKHN